MNLWLRVGDSLSLLGLGTYETCIYRCCYDLLTRK